MAGHGLRRSVPVFPGRKCLSMSAHIQPLAWEFAIKPPVKAKEQISISSQMLPKTLLHLRTKSLNESTAIVCKVPRLPASQALEKITVELPDTMGSKSPHTLTLAWREPGAPEAPEGIGKWALAVSTGIPIGQPVNAAITGGPPSKSILSAWSGQRTSPGIWEGLSERGRGGWGGNWLVVPTQIDKHAQPAIYPPAQAGNTTLLSVPRTNSVT